MNVGRVWHQRQITVFTAIKTGFRVAAHDALQQDATSHLQAPSFKETRPRHHFAARHAVKVGGHAFNFVNASQCLHEWSLTRGGHDAFLVEHAARGNPHKIRSTEWGFQAIAAGFWQLALAPSLTDRKRRFKGCTGFAVRGRFAV